MALNLALPPATPPAILGWLIVWALVYYGGSSFLEDLGSAVGVDTGDDDGPLISLPVAALVLGLGLFAFATRR